ncbi:head-tail connector protein [Acinetobacter modestus]|uniref:head-tail connector protein n=1 Tax=Acinetobacter modestus TaxID=1776740 RepID=UPI003017272A
MTLTVDDVASHLRYDLDDQITADLQRLLDASTQQVQDHVKTKFNAENKVQQLAILLLCGYYDKYRNAETGMPMFGDFLPDPVRALLNPYYVPLVM